VAEIACIASYLDLCSIPTMTKREIRATLATVPADRRLTVAFALADVQQKEIAAQVGVSAATLSRTAAGLRLPSDDERRAIARALDLSVSDLFGQEVAA
jgi:transcriptional regulator with XRE-family HTH domain